MGLALCFDKATGYLTLLFVGPWSPNGPCCLNLFNRDGTLRFGGQTFDLSQESELDRLLTVLESVPIEPPAPSIRHRIRQLLGWE